MENEQGLALGYRRMKPVAIQVVDCHRMSPLTYRDQLDAKPSSMSIH